VQQGFQPGDIGLEQIDGRPGPERRREVRGPVVPGAEQRGVAEFFDAERARQRHGGERRTGVPFERDPLADLVRRRIHVVRRLGRGVQRPAVEVRRLAARPQPLHERLRPEVLVNVDHQPLLSPV
jgi:hypothetical protein